MTPDGELLRRYAETNSEDAFAKLVRRHLDLVYSAALRQVNGDAHLAQDVAQLVFADLARKAASLVGRQAIAGWLYTGAHYAAAKAVRTEQRRHTREQEAHATQELLRDPGPNPDWETLRPALDTAMHELNEGDREAILLRYFENRPHADIGEQLGLSENAARMRIERALEKLRTILSRRGVTTTVALSAALSANAVTVAPAGLAVTISSAAALAGTAVHTSTALATKAIAMTTTQKAIIAVTLVAAVGTGIFEAQQASTSRNQVQTLQQQQGPLADQIQQLQRERDEATNRLASLANEIARMKNASAELLKLRGEVARLRGNAQAQSNDPIETDMKSWLVRVSRLKQRLAETPGAKIPEMRLLDEEDYMGATSGLLNRERDYLAALSNLRSSGEFKFITTFLNPALTQYAQANNGQFPTDLSQLQPYFPSPVEDAILERWEIAPAKTVRTDNFGDTIITTKAAVDEDWDPRYAVGLKGFASAGRDTAGRNGWGVVSPDVILGTAAKAYLAANNGQQPSDPSQLLPYLTTPEQQAAYQKMRRWNQRR